MQKTIALLEAWKNAVEKKTNQNSTGLKRKHLWNRAINPEKNQNKEHGKN